MVGQRVKFLLGFKWVEGTVTKIKDGWLLIDIGNGHRYMLSPDAVKPV